MFRFWTSNSEQKAKTEENNVDLSKENGNSNREIPENIIDDSLFCGLSFAAKETPSLSTLPPMTPQQPISLSTPSLLEYPKQSSSMFERHSIASNDSLGPDPSHSTLTALGSQAPSHGAPFKRSKNVKRPAFAFQDRPEDFPDRSERAVSHTEEKHLPPTITKDSIPSFSIGGYAPESPLPQSPSPIVTEAPHSSIFDDIALVKDPYHYEHDIPASYEDHHLASPHALPPTILPTPPPTSTTPIPPFGSLSPPTPEYEPVSLSLPSSTPLPPFSMPAEPISSPSPSPSPSPVSPVNPLPSLQTALDNANSCEEIFVAMNNLSKEYIRIKEAHCDQMFKAQVDLVSVTKAEFQVRKIIQLLEVQQGESIERDDFAQAEALDEQLQRFRKSHTEFLKQSLAYRKAFLKEHSALIDPTKDLQHALASVGNRLERSIEDDRREIRRREENETGGIETERRRLLQEKRRIELSQENCQLDLERIKGEKSHLDGILGEETATLRERREKLYLEEMSLRGEMEELERRVEVLRQKRHVIGEEMHNVEKEIGDVESKFSKQLTRLRTNEERLRLEIGEINGEEEERLKGEERLLEREKNFSDWIGNAERVLAQAIHVIESSDSIVALCQKEIISREGLCNEVNGEKGRKEEGRDVEEELQAICQEILSLETRLQESSQELQQFQTQIQSLEVLIPTLHAQKKSAALTKNFKEALRLSEEIKIVETEKGQILHELSQLSMATDKMEKTLVEKREACRALESLVNEQQKGVFEDSSKSLLDKGMGLYRGVMLPWKEALKREAVTSLLSKKYEEQLLQELKIFFYFGTVWPTVVDVEAMPTIEEVERTLWTLKDCYDDILHFFKDNFEEEAQHCLPEERKVEAARKESVIEQREEMVTREDNGEEEIHGSIEELRIIWEEMENEMNKAEVKYEKLDRKLTILSEEEQYEEAIKVQAEMDAVEDEIKRYKKALEALTKAILKKEALDLTTLPHTDDPIPEPVDEGNLRAHEKSPSTKNLSKEDVNATLQETEEVSGRDNAVIISETPQDERSPKHSSHHSSPKAQDTNGYRDHSSPKGEGNIESSQRPNSVSASARNVLPQMDASSPARSDKSSRRISAKHISTNSVEKNRAKGLLDESDRSLEDAQENSVRKETLEKHRELYGGATGTQNEDAMNEDAMNEEQRISDGLFMIDDSVNNQEDMGAFGEEMGGFNEDVDIFGSMSLSNHHESTDSPLDNFLLNLNQELNSEEI